MGYVPGILGPKGLVFGKNYLKSEPIQPVFTQNRCLGPQNPGFPGAWVFVICYSCVWKPLYITYHPHYGVGTLTLLPSRRGYRTKLGESTTHIMPPDVMYPLFLNRLGRGATRPPLAERGSKLGSRTLGADHSGGHLYYPLWKPTWIMPTLHLTIENHGTHTKAIINLVQ